MSSGPVAWTKEKPTVEGAYWVRGWNLDPGGSAENALVTVAIIDCELCSDLNECNTARARDWLPIERHSDSFEWLGPLYAALPELLAAQPASSAGDQEPVLAEIRAAADQGGATEGQCYDWWRKLAAPVAGAAAQPLDYAPGKLDRTAPARIWLQIDTATDNSERALSFPARKHDLTWNDSPVGGLEVQYLRADLAAQPDRAAEYDDAASATPTDAEILSNLRGLYASDAAAAMAAEDDVRTVRAFLARRKNYAFPPAWDACAVTAMPSSRSKPSSSSAP